MKTNRKITGRFMAFVLFALLQPAAEAAVKNGDHFEDWVTECHAFEAGKTICVLSQTIANTKSNQRIVKFSIRKSDTAGEHVLTAIVPLGIYLPAGVSITVSAGQAEPRNIPLSMEVCTPQGCIATTRVDAALLKAMQSGDGLGIGFVARPGAKPVALKGSLKGFAEGIKALK